MQRVFTREEFAAKLNANGDPKLNAAADFAARLLNSPVGDSIARIVLFGSVARGEAGAGSDVDLLVFGTGSLDRLSWAAAEAAAESVLESGELVAPLIYGVGQLRAPRSYFMYHSLRRGKEIYRMDDQTLRVEEARGLAHKAERILRQSEVIFVQGGYETAIEAAYNAAELAVKALLLLKPGVELPGTHGGVGQIFGREYVRTGEVPREWSALLSQKLQLRNRAWYDAQADFTDADARSVIEFARDVIDFLQKRLEALLR